MGSKTFVLLGLLLVTLLLITSKVTARDLAEEENSGIEDAKYGGGGRCYGPGCYGGGGGRYGGGGGRCYGRGCYGGGGCYGRGCYGGGGGYGCRYGCCGYHGYNGGCRCCSYFGEPVDKED